MKQELEISPTALFLCACYRCGPRCVGGSGLPNMQLSAASGPYTGLQHHLTAGCRSALPPVARSLWCFFILHLPPPQHSLTAFHFRSLCQCLVSSMILVLIIISLSLNLSGLKSRANDGVAKTCILSCVQQGATPLGVTVQKPVRRERASCSVKLFPGEFLVSGCILSLTEKSIKFIL